jgi:hypothetical protein
MPEFIPGLRLSELYYHEAVAPILARHFPALPHAAALIGYSSEVQGFDDARSTDHMWGPRLVLLLPPDDFAATRAAVDVALRAELPLSFYGYSTNFGGEDHEGTRLLQPVERGPVNHLVQMDTLAGFFEGYLGHNPSNEISVLDWLTFSEHRLRAVTGGRVYNDDLGLEAARQRYAYYPEDVWRYLLAADWMKISQEEPFVGRTSEVGDEAGSRIIAARLCQDVMHLGFLMERVYAPYSKWFGTAVARLECSPALLPLITAALSAPDYPHREQYLTAAYEHLARMHNALGITAPLPEQVSLFHNRPFRVIHGEVFADAILASISDEAVRALPRYVGSVNQWVEPVDVKDVLPLLRKASAIYT